MALHSSYTDPTDLHEEKHARDAALGSVLQFQGDGSGLAVLAQIGQAAVDVISLAQTLTADQSIKAYLKFTSALTGAIVVTAPDTWGPVLIENGCTAAASFTVKTLGGTGASVSSGKRCFLLADGTNVIAGTPEV